MGRCAPRIGLLVVTLIAALARLSPVTAGATHALVTRSAPRCAPKLKFLAHGFGGPDDLAVRQGHLLFGDIKAGYVVQLNGGKRDILARGLNVPEGIVVQGKEQLVVVEQGYNRLDTINLRTHKRSVLLQLVNDTSSEGVDDISEIGGDIIIPNSPYGTVLRLHKGHLHLIVSGLSRPVDAISYSGGLAIADEDANAIWLFRRGHLTRMATVPTPDDVTVVDHMLLAVTLGDGGLWEIRPHVRRLTAAFNQPQGLTTLGARTAAVASQNQNALYAVSFKKGCRP